MNANRNRSDLEAVGEAFDMTQLLLQRARTQEAIAAIAAAIRPGMLEEEAVALANSLLAERQMRRGWHKVNLRFGVNTTLTFHSASQPRVALGANDIFFIDIGPVFERWEGDGGDTFVVGHDTELERCAADARAVFHAARRRWLTDALSGQALYDFAAAEAARRGWVLNLEMNGHRIGDFPHKAIFDGSLAQVDFAPTVGLWVLEIQIRHPDKPFGAFFEDLLLGDEHFGVAG
jgi:Metallopeptidase family M24